MSKPAYSLKEIANWAGENSKIKLPNVQRDFVWKPSQIEDLWDSILRGYPIGSFVLSKSEKSNKLELLDGQQSDEIKAWLKLIPDKSFQQKTIGFLNKTIMKKFNTQEINK